MEAADRFWRSPAVRATGNGCSSERAARRSDLGCTGAEKLTGVWSSTAACSGEGELPMVALSGEQGGKITGQGGDPRRCHARGWVGGVDLWPGVAGDWEESTVEERGGAMFLGQSLVRRLETSTA
jgi:hypothetical protein